MVIIGLLISINSATLEAQLFHTQRLYPNTKVIKERSYYGCRGGKYWSLAYVDSIGRIISKDEYHNNKLISRQKIVYDDNNNKIFDIYIKEYDDRPKEIDTLIRYEYKYQNNRIVHQLHKFSENDSIVTKLIENKGDTLLKYQKQAFYYRPDTKNTDIYETIYTLKYKNGLLVSKEEKSDKGYEIKLTKYEYFENKRLNHRLIERTSIYRPNRPSIFGIKPIYTGVPGSDDEYYRYKLDSKGRVKVFYRIIDGKEYKIASYRYK